MSRLRVAALAVAGALAAAGVASAESTFPYSCSNIDFAYSDSSQATLRAMCLRADGSATASSLVLQGISNQNGQLTQGSGASTFQQSCGSIRILASGPNVTLSAYCRTSGGSSNSTSLPLNGINNNNGQLSY